MIIHGEIVFFYLYDAGRSIDLARVEKLIPVSRQKNIAGNHRDTPASLTLPIPLTVELARINDCPGAPFYQVVMTARIFTEGAISICVRTSGDFRPEDMYAMRTRKFLLNGQETCIDTWVDSAFRLFFEKIRVAITFGQYVFSSFVRETYTAYCITSKLENPEEFIRTNSRTITCLLNGDNPETDIHDSQIETTLHNAFCYTVHDYAIFDLDRCLLIDSEQNYEDILLVVEQANFLLLELRALDMLLDRWLEQAEKDVRIVFRRNTVRLKLVKAKLASIQALSFDALFILENLENSSKIIGDYFLGQIFNNLCSLFNTDGWTRSIDRRLVTLNSVYERVNQHAAEHRMLWLEVMFIAVCILFPLLQILQVFFLSR